MDEKRLYKTIVELSAISKVAIELNNKFIIVTQQLQGLVNLDTSDFCSVRRAYFDCEVTTLTLLENLQNLTGETIE